MERENILSLQKTFQKVLNDKWLIQLDRFLKKIFGLVILWFKPLLCLIIFLPCLSLCPSFFLKLMLNVCIGLTKARYSCIVSNEEGPYNFSKWGSEPKKRGRWGSTYIYRSLYSYLFFLFLIFFWVMFWLFT